MFKKLIKYIIIGVCIDQFSKLAVSFFMETNQSISVISNFFNLTYVKNTGAAFSMFSGFRWILVLVSLLALNAIYIFFIKDKELKNYEIIIYSFLSAGIIGNMIDRIVYGYVIDFFHFEVFSYDAAIFNMADSFIVVTVIILLINSFRGEKCKNILSK